MLKQAKPIPNAAEACAPTSRSMTYGQFLRRLGDNPHAEWVNGEVVMMAPITSEHNDLTGWLYALVRAFVEHHAMGVVRHDPFQMKTGPKLPGRAPDLLFVANARLSRLKRTYLDGPADLVVEIISEGSRATDRGEKYYEYEKGGVREYWLIDPLRKQAEFYQLGRDKRYQLVPAEADEYRSAVLKGLWVKVSWLWQKPLPPLFAVQKAWKLG